MEVVEPDNQVFCGKMRENTFPDHLGKCTFLNLRNFHVACFAAFHIFAQLELDQTPIN